MACFLRNVNLSSLVNTLFLPEYTLLHLCVPPVIISALPAVVVSEGRQTGAT